VLKGGVRKRGKRREETSRGKEKDERLMSLASVISMSLAIWATVMGQEEEEEEELLLAVVVVVVVEEEEEEEEEVEEGEMKPPCILTEFAFSSFKKGTQTERTEENEKVKERGKGRRQKRQRQRRHEPRSSEYQTDHCKAHWRLAWGCVRFFLYSRRLVLHREKRERHEKNRERRWREYQG
jgi:hypothetical protein